jgi:hypothetical protein
MELAYLKSEEGWSGYWLGSEERWLFTWGFGPPGLLVAGVSLSPLMTALPSFLLMKQVQFLHVVGKARRTEKSNHPPKKHF